MFIRVDEEEIKVLVLEALETRGHAVTGCDIGYEIEEDGDREPYATASITAYLDDPKNPTLEPRVAPASGSPA